MNPFACILANGFEDLLEVLPWLVILGIGFLIKIVTSAAKKKPAEQQKQRLEELREERAESFAGQQAQGPTQRLAAPPAPPPASLEPPAVLQPVRTEAQRNPLVAKKLEAMPTGLAGRRPVEVPAVVSVGLGLTDVDRARKAILYHEVFSSCKALRRDSEMWDL